MTLRLRHLFLVGCLLMPCGAGAAEPLPGHSSHGETFDEGPRQAAVLMEGCGHVHLPITAQNPLSHKFFDQGIGQLHGFWYFEAERSFRQVALLEPDCAMAYWGCAMANFDNNKRATGFIKEAVRRKDKASPREKAWIDALDAYLKTPKENTKQRELSFIQALEDIIHDYPKELEAKAFLAWAIWHARDASVPMVSREAVDAIISQVLAVEPMHPIHHYRIHLWDDSRPERAVASAGLCGQSAPAIAHMWHMPGHTYSKVERPEDAAWQQEAALRVDHAYMIRTQILPDQIHNYAHNTEWFIRTLIELGEIHKAVDIAEHFVENPRHPKWNNPGGKGNSANFSRTRLVETLLRAGLWDELSELGHSGYLDETSQKSWEAQRLRALGIAEYFRQDAAAFEKQRNALEALLPHEKEPAPTPAAKEGEDKASQESKVAKDTKKPNKDQKQIEEALAELNALAPALTDHQKEESLQRLAACKDIPKERRVRYLLQLGDKEKAGQLVAQLSGDNALDVALQVMTFADGGKMDAARGAFDKLRKVGAHMDTDLPWSKRLDEIAQSLGLPAPWQQPHDMPEDHGVRPPLDSLGPLSWHPFPAPTFTLQSNQQKAISLASYTGKPVVVLFYLGGACEHCVEQLKAFKAAAQEFKEAGIDILAVGSEVADELGKTQLLCDAKAGVPFPLLADPELATFKAFRCFDDFEQKPLHGTFLVDGKGQIRWLDVSYEPFTNATFLLQEARRLLRFANP